MKKLILVVLALSLVSLTGCGAKQAVAGEVGIIDQLKKLPAVNNAVIYSVDNKEFQYASTVTVPIAILKEKVDLDIGWTPEDEVILAASYKLVEVKDYVKFPILDLIKIEPMVYIGYSRLGVTHAQNEFDYGVGVKLLEAKF